MIDPLSYEAIAAARRTLTAAAHESLGDVTQRFPGAIDQDDPASIFIEAKRNLAALTQWKHGEDTFARLLNEDA